MTYLVMKLTKRFGGRTWTLRHDVDGIPAGEIITCTVVEQRGKRHLNHCTVVHNGRKHVVQGEPDELFEVPPLEVLNATWTNRWWFLVENRWRPLKRPWKRQKTFGGGIAWGDRHGDRWLHRTEGERRFVVAFHDDGSTIEVINPPEIKTKNGTVGVRGIDLKQHLLVCKQGPPPARIVL